MQKPLLLLVLSTFTVLISSAQTTHQVAVTNNVFTPANLTIEVGDIVEWTCTQGTHNVNGTTATFPSNPESFGNSVAPATWTYSHTFTTVGDYDYQCDPHQFIGMVGTITVDPCSLPEIEFIASANNLTVDFTNTTVGNLTGTLWDFGDGNISFNNETPQHAYAAEGTYTVCLTGTNNCGSDSTCQTVAVSCPDAESVFSYSAAGLSVGFTDASLNTPTSWLWDYGDGNISTQQNPNHTYAASGTYTVCLTVTNDCGTDSSCQSVTTTLPDNDDCANATLLTVGSSCSLQTFDSQFHTAENPQPVPNPGCGFFQGSDVWFRAVVPVSGALRIERDNGTLNAQFAIYSGTCGSMEVISCAQLDAARTIHRPDLAGQEVYIRVWGYNTANGGTFDICVWEPEIPVNNYCADAIELTVGQTCELDTFTCIYATADTTPNQPNPGCGFYQGGDVWFTFDMPSSGELRIDRANISGNAQYAVYDGTCGNFAVLDCAQLDNGTTLVLPDQANETLYLRVWGYNSEEGAEFVICLWDPPVPVNDLCANAIPLSVGDTCSFSAFSSRYATTDTAGTAPGPGCGFYQGGDVWFTVEMPVTGMLHLERENLDGNAQFALYEGTCGNFTSVIDCAQLTSEMEINEPTLAGETLYLRVFGYNSEEGAEFEFCAYDTTCNSFEIEIVLQGNTLMSTSAHFSYLWIGCPGTPDPGLLTATFTPTVSGEYRLIADDPTGYGCLDTSNCLYVLVTDIEQSMESSVEIYPNPSNGIVRLDLSGTVGNRLLQVLAIDGSLIRSFATAKTQEQKELNLETGIYIVKWASEKGEIRTKRLVILNQ